MSDKIPDKGKLKGKELSTREKAFVSAYINTESPTFGNGTRSMLKAHPGIKETTAGTLANRTLKRDKIQSAIDQALAKAGITIADRASALAEAIKGQATKEAKTYHVIEGERVLTSVVEAPAYTGRDKLQAIDLVNRMDGTYERVLTEGTARREAFKRLIRKHFPVKGG